MLTHTPTATRPLLGQTILLVEDSLYACDAMRLLALRSGARIRRADRLASARRHLAVYRPSVAIIDFGLPDGSGADLVRDLAQAPMRIDVILATSGDTEASETAFKAGADDFIAKPIRSLAAFQAVILKHLPDSRKPRGLRALSEEEVSPDAISLRDDIDHVQSLLATPSPEVLPYAAQFLDSLAQAAQLQELAQIARVIRAASAACGDAPPDLKDAIRQLAELQRAGAADPLGRQIA